MMVRVKHTFVQAGFEEIYWHSRSSNVFLFIFKQFVSTWQENLWLIVTFNLQQIS